MTKYILKRGWNVIDCYNCRKIIGFVNSHDFFDPLESSVLCNECHKIDSVVIAEQKRIFETIDINEDES